MDRVIRSISEIESDSVKIMNDANAQKSEIFAQIQQETENYDAELEIKTAARIAELKNHLEKDMEEKLERQKQLADASLKKLEQHYESQRTQYVERLFKEMTGV